MEKIGAAQPQLHQTRLRREKKTGAILRNLVISDGWTEKATPSA